MANPSGAKNKPCGKKTRVHQAKQATCNAPQPHTQREAVYFAPRQQARQIARCAMRARARRAARAARWTPYASPRPASACPRRWTAQGAGQAAGRACRGRRHVRGNSTQRSLPALKAYPFKTLSQTDGGLGRVSARRSKM